MVYYELLKPGETINTKHYQQQLTHLKCSLHEKKQNTERGNKKWSRQQIQFNFLHDNGPSHTTKRICGTLKALSWEVLPHEASDYSLFASMGHALADLRFDSYEDVKKWLDECFAAKVEDFYWHGVHKLLKRWENV